MKNKVSFTFDTSDKKDVKKTVDIDFFKSIEDSGDTIIVKYYDQNENIQQKYCKSVEIHN